MSGTTLARGRGLPSPDAQSTFTAHVPLVVSPTGDALRLPLDEFRHATTVAAILDEFLSTASRPLRLLEIRAANQTSLSLFLDPLQVNVAVGRMRPDGRLELAAGDAAVFDDEGQIEDGAFDAVVGLDLLDAVAAERRTAALHECLRIAKQGVVGTAVNRVPTVCGLERTDATNSARQKDAIAVGHEVVAADERSMLARPTPAELQVALRSVGPHVVEFDCVPADVWYALRTLNDSIPHDGIGPDLRQRVLRNLRESGSISDSVPYRTAFVCGSSSRAVAHLRDHPLISPTARAFRDDAEVLASSLRCESQLAGRTLEQLQTELHACHGQVGSQHGQIQTLHGELAGIRNTWSWKLAAPLRWIEGRMSRALQFIVRLFWRTVWSVFTFRYTLRHLRPAHEIDGIPETGTWLALGNDPQFHCPTLMISGWLRITLRMRSDTAGRVMLYHDDTGHGFNGTDVWTIGSLRPDHWLEVRKTIWHGRPIHSLRFDPVDAPAKLIIERFEVACIPGWLRVASELRPRIAAAYSRGLLTSKLRTALRLLMRGDFAALRRKLSNSSTNEPAASADSQYELWRELRRLRLESETAAPVGAVSASESLKVSFLFCPGSASQGAVKRSVESILRQTSSQWELRVTCDTSTPERVQRWLAQQAKLDRRVRMVSDTPAASTVGAINRALSLATGHFVARLNAGDELAEQAVSSIVQTGTDHADVDLIYADEDRVNESGRHSDPFFKSDWSPEYFLAANYLGPVTFFRTSLVRDLGGFREGYADAADYDLALRCIARTSRVHHIADVLGHRGEPPICDASRVAEAERKALREYLLATGQDATVEPGLAPNTHRVRRPARGEPIVSVIIPSACGQATINGETTWFVLKCVQSIRQRSTYPRVEILVVDNNDMPPDLERELRQYDIRCVHFVEPFNLSAKMNQGTSEATGDHLVFMNDDIEVISPEWIESCLDFSQYDGVGAVGVKLLFPNGCLQHVGVTILDGNPGHPFYLSPGNCPGYFHSTQVHRNYVAVTGACVMTRANVFRELGGFDVRFPLNYNDVDYCLRVLESGRRNVFTPYAELFHHESVSKSGTTLDELANFKRKWGTRYRVDPYYNPNLTVTRSDYALVTMDAA